MNYKNLEIALKNTIIVNNIEYRLTLKSFFKDQFQYYSNCYLIPFSHIQYTRRQIFSYIYENCGVTCSKLQKCHGHQFLEFIELIYQFNRYSIIKKKVIYKYFLFANFKLTCDITMTLKPSKIKSWRVLPVDMELLQNLTYSQRLSFLK